MKTILKSNRFFELVLVENSDGEMFYEVKSAVTKKVYFNSFTQGLADSFYNSESDAFYVECLGVK